MRAKIGGVGGVGRRDRGAGGAKKKKMKKKGRKRVPCSARAAKKMINMSDFRKKKKSKKDIFFGALRVIPPSGRIARDCFSVILSYAG